MRIVLLLFIGPLLWGGCSETRNDSSGVGSFSEQQFVSVDSICQAFMDRGNTVGMSIGLSHNGKTVFSKGYGLANITSQKPATDSTIYAIASVSKFVTAIATMKMIEEGRLALTDKVVDHLEDFPHQEHMDEITIEHLLRHQSGLVDHEDWFDSIYINEKRVFTNQELYTFLNRPLFFRPGTNYTYSNSGYAILSSILESIEQKSFHQIIKEKIGKPLAIHSLGMWPENWQDEHATMGYELVNGEVDTSLHMMTKSMKGDGGLSSSVVDLLQLMDHLAEGSIVSDSVLSVMLTPTPIFNILVDYGLGVKFGRYAEQFTFGHSGGYKGTTWAMVMHYPESGFTFAAAMNTNYSPDEIMDLRHMIMPVVLNAEPPTLDDDARVVHIEKYVGQYSAFNRWGTGNPPTRVASSKDGKLFWQNPFSDNPARPLFQINDSIFTWAAYPYDQLRFHHVDGEVVACSEYYDGMFGMVRIKNDTLQSN